MSGKAIELVGSPVVHEFDDGWKLFDLQSTEDMNRFGTILCNCWKGDQFGFWAKKILPVPEGEEPEDIEARARSRWDRPEYRKAHGDSWVETRIENDKKAAPERCYKLIALVDDKGNLSAGASLGLRQFPGIVYGGCDGLSQKRLSWVELDGYEFCVLQTAPFTLTGAALDHLLGWYQGCCKGEFQESLALAKTRELAAKR